MKALEGKGRGKDRAAEKRRLDIGLPAVGLGYRCSMVKGSFRCKRALKALGTR